MITKASTSEMKQIYPKSNSEFDKTAKIDIHNSSLNDVKKVLGNMNKNGELSIKDMLPFIALEITDEVKRAAGGKELHIQYYGEVWEKPNMKRDMLAAYENILKEQMANNESIDSINMTKKAIELLKSIDKNSHNSKFNETLGKTLEKPLEEYKLSSRITQDVTVTYLDALKKFDEKQRIKITSSLVSLKDVDTQKQLSDTEIVDFKNMSQRVKEYLNSTKDEEGKTLVDDFWKEFNKLYSPNKKFNDLSISSQDILQLKQSFKSSSKDIGHSTFLQSLISSMS